MHVLMGGCMVVDGGCTDGKMPILNSSLELPLTHYRISYLMHSSGYFAQSVIHLNRCQVIQPMGGVRASPLSSPTAVQTMANSEMARLSSHDLSKILIDVIFYTQMFLTFWYANSVD